MNQNTSLAVSGANLGVALLPSLFRDVDFGAMSGAIKTLADSSKELSADEKASAITIIDQWEDKVIDRLKKKDTEFGSFLYFLGHTDYTYGYGDRRDEDKLRTIGAELAERTNTRDEYNALMVSIGILNKLKQARPEQPVEDDEKSRIQMMRERQEYDLAYAKYSNSVNRAEREVQAKQKAWLNLVNDNAEVKDTVSRVKAFRKNLQGYIDQCRDQSDFAKMNVAISNEATRSALRQMLDFSVEI